MTRKAHKRGYILCGLIGAAAVAGLAWVGYASKSDGAPLAFLRAKVPLTLEYQLFAVDRLATHGTRIRYLDSWESGHTSLKTGSMPWKAETIGDRTFCIRRYVADIKPQAVSPSVQDQLAAEGFHIHYLTGLTADQGGESEFFMAERSNGDKAVISWFRPDKGPQTIAIEVERATTIWEKAESQFRRLFNRR